MSFYLIANAIGIVVALLTVSKHYFNFKLRNIKMFEKINKIDNRYNNKKRLGVYKEDLEYNIFKVATQISLQSIKKRNRLIYIYKNYTELIDIPFSEFAKLHLFINYEKKLKNRNIIRITVWKHILCMLISVYIINLFCFGVYIALSVNISEDVLITLFKGTLIIILLYMSFFISQIAISPYFRARKIQEKFKNLIKNKKSKEKAIVTNNKKKHFIL